MEKEDKIIAVDIGGTSIKVGEYINQKIINVEEYDTNAKLGGAYVMDRVTDIISRFAKFKAIGISTAGQVDSKNGVIIYANNNIPHYTGVKVREILETRFEVPVAVENDVNAAAIGEAYFGAGKDFNNFLCLTYGTGVGGAIVIDKKLYTGSEFLAGEMGGIITHGEERLKEINSYNMSLKNDSLNNIDLNNNNLDNKNLKNDGLGNISLKDDTCIKNIEENSMENIDRLCGCYERYASTSALVKMALEKDGKLTNGRKIFARINEPKVYAIVEDWVKEIVLGLTTLIHLFNPQGVILGGGVMEQKIVLELVRKYLYKSVIPSFSKVEIRQASLGNKAGLLGAAIKADKIEII